MPLGAQISIVVPYLPWAWLVTHGVLLVRVLLVRTITTSERWYSILVPPRAAFVAWHHGMRAHVVVWVALVALYGVSGAVLMLGGLPLGAQLLLVAIVLLWAWLVAHVALIARLLAENELGKWAKLALLLQVSAPYLGWQHGRRRHAILWLCLAALYGACRAALTLR